MTIQLNGLALKNFRGIGPEWVIMSGFSKFNFFIGPNNSGKSAVLAFIRRYLDEQNRSAGVSKYFDHHESRTETPIEYAIAEPVSLLREGLRPQGRPQLDSQQQEVIDAITRNLLVTDDFVFPIRTEPYIQTNDFVLIHRTEWRTLLNSEQWSLLANTIAPAAPFTEQDRSHDHFINRSRAAMSEVFQFRKFNVRLISAIRSMRLPSSFFDVEDYSGAGLMNKLSELQAPRGDQPDHPILFQKITEFFQQVTGVSDATFQIQHDKQEVNVRMNGRFLPLASLGTGIEEVIMIASFCTISQNHIVCIEEPEIHLHPKLQRQLMNYLRENTNNQYFIATHSAAFIDTPDASIFQVKLHENKTKIEKVSLRNNLFFACQDLGYRASDILQSNAIIWVEGPSDRIYLNF